MSSSLDIQLISAAALVVVGVGLFGWHLFSRFREAGTIISDSRVPRRYILLGIAVGFGILYLERDKVL